MKQAESLEEKSLFDVVLQSSSSPPQLSCLFFFISGLSNRIGFDSIRLSIQYLQKAFDSISIRFDTQHIAVTIKKNWKLGSWHFFKGVFHHQEGTNKWKLFVILFCKLFKSFSRHITGALLFRFLSISNRIVSKSIQFNLSIQFDLGKFFRFDNEIRFDFDSIWQPCFIRQFYLFLSFFAFFRTLRVCNEQV
jgi:hypothetical protein